MSSESPAEVKFPEHPSAEPSELLAGSRGGFSLTEPNEGHFKSIPNNLQDVIVPHFLSSSRLGSRRSFCFPNCEDAKLGKAGRGEALLLASVSSKSIFKEAFTLEADQIPSTRALKVLFVAVEFVCEVCKENGLSLLCPSITGLNCAEGIQAASAAAGTGSSRKTTE